MPAPKDAKDLTGKRHCHESDDSGQDMSSSDRDAPAPPDVATATRITRSSARTATNKHVKGAVDDNTNASDEGRISSAEEDMEKSDAPAADGALKAVSRTSSTSTTFTAHQAARLQEKYGDLTTQESLDARAVKWTSQVYHHFRKPMLVKKKDGTLTSRFVCIRNPSKHIDRALNDESTGNLNRHIKICVPEASEETQLITEFAQGVNYSYACLCFLLAMWIARRHRPFAIVEDPEFCEILRMLYACVQIPSCVTVSRNLKDIFDDSRARVKEKLQSLLGKIHICIDGWTSPNVISYLGVTAHWHKDGQIQHIILDFIKLAKGHTGQYLVHKLMELLWEFGIIEKVVAVTCNNAANNATMLKEMKKENPEFRGPDACVRCFGHVINLVVKAILSQFGQNVKSEAIGDTDRNLSALDDPEDEDKEDEDEEDEDEEDKDEVDQAREAADAADIDEEDEPRPELFVSEEDIKLGRLTLQKIIKLSQKVWNSPTVCAEMSQQARTANKKCDVLVRAVRTRWNTVTMVLEHVLELRSILFNVCDKAEFNKAQGLRLRCFIIDNKHWPILEELYELLATFLEATLAISHSSTPLIHDVIPWIDVMTKHLKDTRDNITKLPMVRAAAHKGYKILQKYYRKTDDTPFYHVAMLLHPCYKKKYFACTRWPHAWVKESLRLLRTEWEEHYQNAVGLRGEEETLVASARDGTGEPCGSDKRSTGSQGNAAAHAARNMLALLTGADELEDEDALEEYLEVPIRTKRTDPLKFWNNALANGTANAALARMALDVLSIPATSMDAEHAFSRGRLTVSRLRHSLSDRTVRASTVLGLWARYPILVPEGDAVELLQQKEKGKGKDTGPSGDRVPSKEMEAITILSD